MTELKGADEQIAFSLPELLNACWKAGYTEVSVSDSGVPGAGSILAALPERPRINGWPAIWQICRDFHVAFGCGNGHTHQVRGLPNGKWERREPSEEVQDVEALTDRICWLTGAVSVLLQIAETAREGGTLDAGQLEALDRVKRGYEGEECVTTPRFTDEAVWEIAARAEEGL